MIRFNLSRYYITEENDKRLLEFSKASGDTRQTLIMQFTRGWLGRHRDYFISLAKLDYSKRGMTHDGWALIVVDKGFDGLPDYKSIIEEGEMPSANSLPRVVLPTGMIEKSINYINLSRQNYILLRTAIYFDGGSIATYISKIIHEHLERNWHKLYVPQMEAENSNQWLL
jgi:hypothetical protein